MSRLLFINQYYWPDEAATAQLLGDLAESLVVSGHHVTVLCGRSRYACAEPLPRGSFEHRGVRIERTGGSDWGRHTMKGRLMDNASFLVAAWRRLAALPRHDLVVAMTSPPWVGRLGVCYHERHRVPLVLWLQDIYPEVAERLGALRNPVLRHILRGQSTRIYQAGARIVVLGESMAATLTKRGVGREKLRVIPNWAHLDEIRATPVDENPFRQEQGWANERVLMYSGNVGSAHDIETMVALVARLAKEMPSMRFVLVGDSPRHARLMEDVKRVNVTRTTWLPSQPRARLGDLLGAADAHLVAQKAETEGLVFPSKFYGIVAAGRPVIFVGPRSSELGRIVLDARLGTAVEPGRAADGVSAARQALLMTRDERGVVPRIREWAEQHASHQARLREFGVVVEEVLK